MSIIAGTAGADTIVGSAGDDVIDGGAGKDRLNGGDGNDIINGGADNDYVYGDRGNDTLFGGAGNDALVGDAGNDVIYGEDGNDGVFGGGNDDAIYGGNGADTLYGDGGNDTIDGGADDDKLYGGAGNDRLVGGTGNDVLDGGTGNDTLIYEFGKGTDTLIGGTGSDTLQLELSSDDIAAVRSDIIAFAEWLDQEITSAGGVEAHAAVASGPSFTFESMGLAVQGFEAINVVIDGVSVTLESLMNSAPVAEATQAIATSEDLPVSGAITAYDADGDTLSFAVVEAPGSGNVVLDSATGAFTYTPVADFAGTDSFLVTISDPSGETTTQRIEVTIDAVADSPSLSVGGTLAVAALSSENLIVGTASNDVLTGTAGDDHIVGGNGNDVIYGESAANVAGASVALDISAALGDVDGSETLSVTISGVPDGASLSAGTETTAGTWLLSPSDLAGLTFNADSAMDVTLTVTATASEANGSTASVDATIDLRIEMPTGNDVIDGGAGDDQIHGGTGVDLIDYTSSSSAVSVFLDSGFAIGNGLDTFDGVEGVIGSNYSDSLYGDNGDNIFFGGNGNDAIYAYGGNDTVDGGNGNDNINGYAGDDTLLDGAGADNVYGGDGNDVIIAGNDRDNDYYSGGNGIDSIDYSNVTTGVTIDLGNHQVRGAGNDLVFDIENATGTSQDDTLRGSDAINVLIGGAGNDTIQSGRGADILTGGAGADTFVFTKSDVINGKTHQGVDTITDFGAGDRLDLDGLFSNSDANHLLEHIRIVETGAGSVVSVDLGSAGFVDIALLEGVYGLDAEYMIETGQIFA